VKHFGKPLLALGVCALGLMGLFSGGPIQRPAGVLAPDEPEQTPTRAQPFRFGDFELQPRADYHIVARVLSVESYGWDGGSALSPIDFAVGWGPMSDSSVLAHFRITQGGRFFTIYPDAEAIDIHTALLGAANMHLIPAGAAVRLQLQRVRAGHIVELHGKLVNVSRADGYQWNSSLTRADTGAGACELYYVESVTMK
jgi:hypothetical protein